MDQVVLDPLSEAASRKACAVLCLPWIKGVLPVRTRFLGHDGGRVWAETPGDSEEWVEAAVARGEPVAVHFRAGGTNFRIMVRLGRAEGDGSTAGRLVLETAAPAEEVQRRATYRVGFADAAPFAPRVHAIPAYAVLRDRGLRSEELHPRLLDLGAAGAGLLFSEPLALEPDQLLRIVFPTPDGDLLLGGQVKSILPLPRFSLRVGVEFRQAEYDAKDRQTLTRLSHLVAELQREETRARRGE